MMYFIVYILGARVKVKQDDWKHNMEQPEYKNSTVLV